MPHFETFYLLRSLHLLAMALAGGAAMVILVMVGFEESREDLHGLTALLWKRTVAWGFRIALVLGLILFVERYRADHDFLLERYLHWKFALVLLLLAFSEMAPKALARHRRGAPLLAFLLFLLTVFVSVNHSAFGVRTAKTDPHGAYQGSVQPAR